MLDGISKVSLSSQISPRCWFFGKAIYRPPTSFRSRYGPHSRSRVRDAIAIFRLELLTRELHESYCHVLPTPVFRGVIFTRSIWIESNSLLRGMDNDLLPKERDSMQHDHDSLRAFSLALTSSRASHFSPLLLPPLHTGQVLP
jgi:hypothetical protein